MRDTGPRTTTTTNGLASIGPGGDVLLVNDREACRLLGGVSTRWLWGQTQPRGPIPVCRIGGRVLYSVASLRSFIATQEDAMVRDTVAE